MPGGEDSVFKSGSFEVKPTSSRGAGLTESVAEIASLTFALGIFSNSGAAVCKGEVEAQIFSNFTVKIPKGQALCGSVTVDLAKMLPDITSSMGQLGALSTVPGDKLVYIASIAGASFDPPRPILLRPIVRKPDGFKGLDKTSTHTVTAKSETGETISGRGSFRVEVLSVNETEKIKDNTFDKVIHWRITREGFEGLSALNGLLFDSWEWWFNTSPIMIPRIKIKGTIKDFIQASDPSVMGVFGETVTLELVVLKYKL